MTKFGCPYGGDPFDPGSDGHIHYKAPALYRCVRQNARAERESVAALTVAAFNGFEATDPVQAVQKMNRSHLKDENDGMEWTHLKCRVAHEEPARAVECERRRLWRVAATPEFLAERVTLREYAEMKGWLDL